MPVFSNNIQYGTYVVYPGSIISAYLAEKVDLLCLQVSLSTKATVIEPPSRITWWPAISMLAQGVRVIMKCE